MKTPISVLRGNLSSLRKDTPVYLIAGIADGAKSNWTYLKNHIDRQVLDFYPASGYLGKAVELMYSGNAKVELKSQWLGNACHKLKHNGRAASKLLTEIKERLETKNVSLAKKETLMTSVTYFENNKHMMKYAKNYKENLPIGFGVTEGACKIRVKQRICNSGMRWAELGAQNVLTLRAISHADYRWDLFWKKVDQYGLSVAA